MLFWIFAALLTVIAALAVLRPLARKREAANSGRDHDIEVYRDQFSELDRDVERGVIGREEAEQARAEIGRRILKAAESPDAANPGSVGRARAGRIVAMAGVLAIPLVSWGLYVAIGSPGLPSLPLQARLQQEPENASIDELVARAEAHLAENPDDARGWEVLAPVYMRLGRFKDAETAFRNMVRLSGDTAELQASIGEALVGNARGVVTAEAEAAFQAALALEAKNARARFFTAVAHAQEGEMSAARAIWAELKTDLPADSPWQRAAALALEQSDGEEPGQGPTQEEMTAAAEMAPADQRAMIEGMVESLDSRLAQNPADPEGWRRLIRSYMVLQQPEQAEAALKRGIAGLGADTQEANGLRDFAADLGVTIGE